MSHRNFKDRQTRHLNWIIQQVLAEQRLRDEQEQTIATLSNTIESLDCGMSHASSKAFATIEQKGVPQ